MKRNNHLLFQRSVLSSLVNQQSNYRPHSNLLKNTRSSLSKNILLSSEVEIETENIPPSQRQRTSINPIIPIIEQEKINPEILSTQRKEVELFQKLKQSKHNQEIFKATIKTKFLQANKRLSQTSQNQRSIAPGCRMSTVNSSCTKTSESFMNQKQQINQWIKKNKAMRQSNSISASKAKISLKNTDKFNIDFVQYLKKKSYRRIEKEKINKIVSRKENIVEMYQQHLLKNSGLGLKSKQHMRKCFDFLNNEKRKM